MHSPRPAPRTIAFRKRFSPTVDQLLAKADLTGEVAFVVADALSGEILETRNPQLALPPASAGKIITTLYGLENLGVDYRFATRIIGTGDLVNGQLRGDLYLIGGGDPTLDSDALAEMVRQLKQAGLREITGKTYVYSGAIAYQRMIDPDQPDYLGYDPSLSGLNLNFNRIYFEWSRTKNGFQVSLTARAVKFRPRVTMASMKIVERKSPVFSITSTARKDNWTVAKSGLSRKGWRWLPVRRPQFYTADVFRTVARSFGIDLPAFVATDSPPTGRVFAQWRSDPLQDILRTMLKYSTNIVAEAIGMSASIAKGASPKTLAQSGQMMSDWINSATGATQVKMTNHSGLGSDSRVSASDMVQVLLSSGWNGSLRGLMKEIPFRNNKDKPLKDSPVKVRAKTGTLNFVSALAGYAEAPGGRKLVFAILAADLSRRAKIPKSRRERPPGARGWNRGAKKLQQNLLQRWAVVLAD